MKKNNYQKENSSNTPLILLIFSAFIWVVGIFILKNFLYENKKPVLNQPFSSKRISSQLDNKCVAAMSTSMTGFLPSFVPAPRDASKLNFSQRIPKYSFKKQFSVLAKQEQFDLDSKKESFDLKEPRSNLNPLRPTKVEVKGKANVGLEGPVLKPNLEGDVHMTFDSTGNIEIWKTEKREIRKDSAQVCLFSLKERRVALDERTMARQQARRDGKQTAKQARKNAKQANKFALQSREQDRKDAELALQSREQDRKDAELALQREKQTAELALQREKQTAELALKAEKQKRKQDRKDKRLAHELSLSSRNFQTKNKIDDEAIENNTDS
nr:hypothetical protein [Interfilum sp. SAG 36.88]